MFLVTLAITLFGLAIFMSGPKEARGEIRIEDGAVVDPEEERLTVD
jgi:hypothetical protein